MNHVNIFHQILKDSAVTKGRPGSSAAVLGYFRGVQGQSQIRCKTQSLHFFHLDFREWNH